MSGTKEKEPTKKNKNSCGKKTAWFPKPMPYYGSKIAAVDLIWGLAKDSARALIEPFVGSACVAATAPDGIKNIVINDSNALLVNFWRAVHKDPQGVLEAATRPCSDLDMWAAEYACKDFAKANAQRMAADIDYCDVNKAGLFLYGQCNYLANNFCTLTGPWVRVPDEEGYLRMEDSRYIPEKSDMGIRAKVPMLNSDVGIRAMVPEMKSDVGIRAMVPEQAMTWSDAMQYIAKRTEAWRVLCGDWKRVVTYGLLNEYDKDGGAFIFLDPPYDDSLGKGQGTDYMAPDGTVGAQCHVSKEVRDWCIENTKEGKCPWTIVLCGRYTEHDELLDIPGWAKVQSKGKSSYATDKDAFKQEYMWCWNHKPQPETE